MGGVDAAAPAVVPPYDQPGLTWSYDVDQAGPPPPISYRADVSIGSPIQTPAGTVYPHTTTFSNSSVVIVTQMLVGNGEIATVRTTTSNSGYYAYDPPLLGYRAGLSPGDGWTQSVSVSGAMTGTVTLVADAVASETVTVPAGTFACLRFHMTYTQPGITLAWDEWWSPTAGFVAKTFASGGSNMRSELSIAPH